MTFASTVNMISLCGGRPVFADVDYGTLNIDAERIERHITPKTKAIIPVHFAGAPVDMDKIISLAKSYHLTVIEDTAHAIGTYYKGIHVGGFGYSAIFSFHPIKNITTAEGGLITLYDPEMERRLRLLRFHGIERDAWKRYGKGGNPEYDIAVPGFKYNLTDLQAALGVAQLSRLPEMNARRKHLANLYLEALRDVTGIELPQSPDYPHTHAWHLFIVKVNGMTREDFFQRLSDYNIGYGIHFPAAHLLDYVKKRYGKPRFELSCTEAAANKIVSLPLFPSMEERDVLYVCDAIKEIVRHAPR